MRAKTAMLAVTALGLMATPMRADAAMPDACTKSSEITLKGRVNDIQSMREEPQAEIETFFVITLGEPICGKEKVTTSIIGKLACRDGDFITITGTFSPPSKMFDTARLKGERSGLRCYE